MSNIQLILEEKAADIGNFMVGRLLPFRQKRAVGPFVFIDHMGPADLKDYQNLDVPPHPHIGLSTLTYLFEGAIFHRDSLGTAREIQAGAVNWMTAGKGVVHSERTPEYLRSTDKKLHGLQIWVALPKHLEQIAPSFHHVEASAIPTWEEDGLHFKLIAGDAFGFKSSVPVHSPLYFLEIKNSGESKTVSIGEQLFGESALYILEGEIKDGEYTYGPKQLLVAKDSKLCSFEMAAHTTVYIFGGEAFPEERAIYWNFVSSSSKVLETAISNWEKQDLTAFPEVPGDTKEFVPLPEMAYKPSPVISIYREERKGGGRFVLFRDGIENGEMTYVWAGKDKFIIDHTEVQPDQENKGLGKRLVLKGVEFARANGLKIMPLCPFAKRVIQGDESLWDVVYR